MKVLNKILIIVGVFALIIAGYFVITNFVITGKVILNTHYTRAICDENNFCQDFEIHCNSGNLVEMFPVDGAIFRGEKNWTDIRNNLTKELC